MDDSFSMSVVERECHLARELNSHFNGELTDATESIPERLAPNVWHGIPQLARGFTWVEHWQDVRVLQTRGRANFTLKAFRTQGSSQLRVHHLEGDFAIVLKVLREVHSRHASAAEFALEDVAFGEGKRKCRGRWQGSPALGGDIRKMGRDTLERQHGGC
jgi:hypothetical protein